MAERYDDGGEPILLLTLQGPSPMGFFVEALEAIAAIAPVTSVVKNGENGYEVWSRPNGGLTGE